MSILLGELAEIDCLVRMSPKSLYSYVWRGIWKLIGACLLFCVISSIRPQFELFVARYIVIKGISG